MKFVYILIAILFFALGIIFGIMLQQAITQSTIEKALGSMEGVNITINLNETKLVDYTMKRFNETILPQLNELNEINKVAMGDKK